MLHCRARHTFPAAGPQKKGAVKIAPVQAMELGLTKREQVRPAARRTSCSC